ncbi:hypothetical protein ACIOWK_28375 [Pseudomonas protegens]|uniref:hypothetical protein n=1 Tax=Pseudomonas protegens TaxID=380021 RepID=UPI0037F15244
MTTYQSGDKAIVSPRFSMYRRLVTANSVIDLGRSSSYRRNGAHLRIAGAFFTPAILSYGGLCGDTFGCAGVLYARSANPAQSATFHRLAATGGSSSHTGATPMNIFTLTPDQIRHKIERHRARAIAQLNTKSSLKVRTERYNAEMARARFFEAMLKGAK